MECDRIFGIEDPDLWKREIYSGAGVELTVLGTYPSRVTVLRLGAGIHKKTLVRGTEPVHAQAANSFFDPVVSRDHYVQVTKAMSNGVGTPLSDQVMQNGFH